MCSWLLSKQIQKYVLTLSLSLYHTYRVDIRTLLLPKEITSWVQDNKNIYQFLASHLITCRKNDFNNWNDTFALTQCHSRYTTFFYPCLTEVFYFPSFVCCFTVASDFFLVADLNEVVKVALNTSNSKPHYVVEGNKFATSFVAIAFNTFTGEIYFSDVNTYVLLYITSLHSPLY